MKNFKHILSFLLIAFFIFLAFGSLFENKNEKKTYKPDSDGSIRISATSLYKEYLDNPVAADEKFKGKTLKVDGNVATIDKGIDGKICVMLETGELIGYIFCYFPDSESKEVAKINRGNYKTIKGKCTGKLVGVVLENCEVY
ncbi:MAG: hypothetical protein NTU73_14960 [Ignavibacteriae bacterium]|nr:hypothetical protein [Ignavibacteriota bacterium]